MAIAISEGVDPNLIKPEWLQQVVASNISPPLPGLAVRPIPLSGERGGKVAYVIFVPKGTTSHQSTDLKYNGRHELEAKPLADNAIRLLMNRGRSAHAMIEISVLSEKLANFMGSEPAIFSFLTADELKQRATPTLAVYKSPAEATAEEIKSHGRYYTFLTGITNDGPITIRECELLLRMWGSAKDSSAGLDYREERNLRFDFSKDNMVLKPEGRGIERQVAKKLFPQQSISFPGVDLRLWLAPNCRLLDLNCEWTLFLDDALPVSGVIDFRKRLHPSGESATKEA